MKPLLLSLLVSLYSIVNGQVLINEICATNGDVRIDTDFGNFSSWIELYNAGNTTQNISGYALSNDPALPYKWTIPSSTTIPAKGHILIWCDEKWTSLHAGFYLDARGGALVLTTTTGIAIDQVTYPQQYTNVSFGRVTNGASDWKFSASPSPMQANAHNATGDPLATPELSKASGRYIGSFSLSMSHPMDGVEIRYTTNGTEPSQNSPLYSGSISVPSTRVIKAKAFKSKHLPSETVAATYLINEHSSNLPVVSISTKTDYLWDNTIGIYADGTNGIPGNCNGNNMNWNQDWKRHATFEYFTPTGERKINQHVDIRIGGACSRNFPQKSFVIDPKTKYGDNDFDYAFFPSKPDVKEFGRLSLNNSGNDFNTTTFRDALLQAVASDQLDVDYMAYQPTVFYLNGEYWGIQNLREKIDGNYVESNYDIDKEDVDLIETWENAIEGDNNAWVTYKNSLATMNPNDPATFDFIEANIDVQEYINYLVTEIYVGNTDWPGNNVKFWRQRSTDGRFRWILWDLDFGFGLYGTPSNHPTLNFATETNGPGWPNPEWSTLHIRLVLQNPEFRSRFISTLAIAMGTTFHPDKVNAFIDQYKSKIESEIPYHKQRWGGTVGDWQYEIQRLRDFSTQRHPYMQAHAAAFFGLDPLKFSVTTSPANAGEIKLNGVTTPAFAEAPYFAGIPYQIEPNPSAGFKFDKWTITTLESETTTLVSMGSAWSYFDTGTLPDANWMNLAYNDAAWAQGNAELGYGDGDETTEVNFGIDINNKHITTYFRKNFILTDTIGFSAISASALYDDGIVVYLNDLEVYRGNMPAGNINNATLALTAAAEGASTPFTIPKGILKPGNNTWAVEIHQSSPASSDISFDFHASVSRKGNQETYESKEAFIHDTAAADISIVAHFIPLEPIEGLVLNEVSAAKSFARDEAGDAEDWIELFNAGTQPVNLAGLMITDDLTQIEKHVMDKNTPWMLAPGAYQVLWADGDPEQGKNHLNFKLSNTGEALGVYHMAGFDLNVIAEIEFEAMDEGHSYARIPNGTGSFKITTLLTPGAENAAQDPITADAWLYPNPANQLLKVQAEEANTLIIIYDLRGTKVASFKIDTIQTTDLDIGHLTEGVYYVQSFSATKERKARIVVAPR